MNTKTFFTFYCCLLVNLAFAQPNNEQRYDSKMIKELQIDDKNKHVLFVGCKEGECDIYWNNKLITSEYSFEAAVDFLQPIENKDFPNLYIIPIYSGDGCPSMYKILQIPDKKNYWLTDAFGNCMPPTTSTKKKTMTFVFDDIRIEEPPLQRKAATYIYNLKKGELEKID